MTSKFCVTRPHIANRVFEHDSECCTFQGHDLARVEDIYYCGEDDLLIRRFSSEPADYHYLRGFRVHLERDHKASEWLAAIATLDNDLKV